MIDAALGDARSVVNVGAGSGSYEPTDRDVTAVEPSKTMIAQRAPDAAPVVEGVAEHLPFADKSFDAATAFLTTHHWSDVTAGLKEMRRVARKRCVFFDHTPNDVAFWLIDDYFPQMRPSFHPLLPFDKARAVFGKLRIVPLPVPPDCTDGFLAAYWRRPHMYLNPRAREAISFFATAGNVEGGIAHLARDLADGTWAQRNAELLDKTEMDYGYRLVIAEL